MSLMREYLLTSAVMRSLDETNIQHFVASGLRRHESLKEATIPAPLPATFNHQTENPLIYTDAQKREIQHDAQIAVSRHLTPVSKGYKLSPIPFG